MNNILESCEADLDLIEKKIKVLCYMGEVEKAEKYLVQTENILKKQKEGLFYLSQGIIQEHQHKRAEAKRTYLNGLRRSPDFKKL